MTQNSVKYSHIDYMEKVEGNRRSKWTLIGKVLAKCPYLPDGQNNGIQPIKKTKLMGEVGFSFEQLNKIYLPLLVEKLGWLRVCNGGYVRTDDGQSVHGYVCGICSELKKKINLNHER